MNMADITQQIRTGLDDEGRADVIDMLIKHPLATASKTTVGRNDWEAAWYAASQIPDPVQDRRRPPNR